MLVRNTNFRAEPSPPLRSGILVVHKPARPRLITKTVRWDDSQTRVLLYPLRSYEDEPEPPMALQPVKTVWNLKEEEKAEAGQVKEKRGSSGDNQRGTIYVDWNAIFKQPPKYTY